MPHCSVHNGAGQVVATHQVTYQNYSFNKGGQYQAIESLLDVVPDDAARINVYEQSQLLSTYNLKGVKPKVFYFITHNENLTLRTPPRADPVLSVTQPVVVKEKTVPKPVIPAPKPIVDSDPDEPISLFD